MRTGNRAITIQILTQFLYENLIDKTFLSGATDACHHIESAFQELHVNILKVIL